MSRSERLLELLQAMRRHRRPVSGKTLAAEIGVSIRTLYRDIASLQAQGAGIEGEPGVGYVLKPGFLLPPLMFTHEEVEALVFGTRWVSMRSDEALAAAAGRALAKVHAVLPSDLRAELEASALLVSVGEGVPDDAATAATLRRAIRNERKLRLAYRGEAGPSDRVVWPFALAYFERSRVVMCWCESREDFRYFRTDRIVSVEALATRYPRRRQALRKAWRETLAPETRFTILPDPDSK